MINKLGGLYFTQTDINLLQEKINEIITVVNQNNTLINSLFEDCDIYNLEKKLCAKLYPLMEDIIFIKNHINTLDRNVKDHHKTIPNLVRSVDKLEQRLDKLEQHKHHYKDPYDEGYKELHETSAPIMDKANDQAGKTCENCGKDCKGVDPHSVDFSCWVSKDEEVKRVCENCKSQPFCDNELDNKGACLNNWQPKDKEPVTRKFRKKRVTVDAYQTDRELIIHTLEGDHKANVGDWIITGVKGEQYPCKPDIFEMTYECEPECREQDKELVDELKDQMIKKAELFIECANRGDKIIELLAEEIKNEVCCIDYERGRERDAQDGIARHSAVAEDLHRERQKLSEYLRENSK